MNEPVNNNEVSNIEDIPPEKLSIEAELLRTKRLLEVTTARVQMIETHLAFFIGMLTKAAGEMDKDKSNQYMALAENYPDFIKVQQPAPEGETAGVGDEATAEVQPAANEQA